MCNLIRVKCKKESNRNKKINKSNSLSKTYTQTIKLNLEEIIPQIFHLILRLEVHL